MVTLTIHQIDISLQEKPAVTLKNSLVNIGLNALRDDDWRRVDLITMLIRAGGLTHE